MVYLCRCPCMNGISVVYLEGFTDSIYTVYTGDKPKPNVNSDAQIVPLPCWLLSLACKPIKDPYLYDNHKDKLGISLIGSDQVWDIPKAIS